MVFKSTIYSLNVRNIAQFDQDLYQKFKNVTTFDFA